MSLPKKNSIRIGLDFDGVVAYNPARLARFPIALIKEKFLGIHHVHFYHPTSTITRSIWSIMHETSVFPALGVTYLRQLVDSRIIEAHLVSGRYGFLKHGLDRFLHRWGLTKVFTSITVNEHEEQPHLFKAKWITDHHVSYYIEDNWDIVQHLETHVSKTKVYWIYNIFDRNKPYMYKFPYLRKALESLPI